MNMHAASLIRHVRPPSRCPRPLVNHWSPRELRHCAHAAFWHKQMATTTLDQRECERAWYGLWYWELDPDGQTVRN